MYLGTRLTRRTALGGAALAVAAIWVPSVSARRTNDEQSWESEDGALAVSWDPDVWTDNLSTTTGTDRITIATDPTFGNDRYWLQVIQDDQSWTSLEEAEQSAMDTWFSQGLNGSVVFKEFSTEDSYGWIHYADFQGNPRTVSILQYRMAKPGSWDAIAMSINIGALDVLDIEDAFAAVSLNDGSVFVIAPQRTMIRAIEDAFTA
ncbi:MAG: hypothetical protein QM589_08990 [Thermomicrobiales bacterium]